MRQGGFLIFYSRSHVYGIQRNHRIRKIHKARKVPAHSKLFQARQGFREILSNQVYSFFCLFIVNQNIVPYRTKFTPLQSLSQENFLIKNPAVSSTNLKNSTINKC